MIRVLVSSCLLGALVRHDGHDKKSSHPVLQRWIEQERVISACPEMLGGLGTPRPPAEIINDGSRRVLTKYGADVTSAFAQGARAAAELAVVHDVRVAIMKSASPSCGSSFIYDGTFTSTRVPGDGVTTALLRKSGIRIFSEDELDAADEYVHVLEHASQ
ncbi:MAG TPA: DUF523 domain-containing protein [Thermoanaerobaculia bacterium]|nr:DUF523 domain-containing protein [Thermoanaerobaculia bacterium]